MRSWASLVLAAALLLCAAPAFAQESSEPGSVAPKFWLPVYNPEPVGHRQLGLAHYAGATAKDRGTRVVLLSFMASYCAPCKKEMPWLEALYRKHRAQGLRVVMVAIDREPEGQKIIEDLIAKNEISYPVLKDRFNVVAMRWLGKSTLLPSLFLVRPDGVISSVHRGYSEDALKALEAEVLSAIAPEPAVAAEAGAP